MTSGKYNIDGYNVIVGHMGDSFERLHIWVHVLSFKNPKLVFEIPMATPQQYLAEFVLSAIAVRKADDQAQNQVNQYAQLN